MKKSQNLPSHIQCCYILQSQEGREGWGMYLKYQWNYVQQHGKFKGSLTWLPHQVTPECLNTNSNVYVCSKFAPISLFVVKPWISGFIFQESRRQFSNLTICIWYYLSTQWPVFMKVAELQRTLCISLNNILKSLVGSG